MFSFRTAARRAPALAIAATMLVSALGLPSSTGTALAAAPDGPAARLQIVVKQVKIHDDRDLFGAGEMRLDTRIWRCKEGLPSPCSGQEYDLSAVADPIARLYDTFSASSGDTVTRDRVVPDQPAGFAVDAGQRYVVRFDMDDSDGAWSVEDDMGKVVHVVDTGEHGLGLGTHTARSYAEERYQDGDYTITYEIRPAPLPDLKALYQIDVHDLPGSAEKRVCMVVQNDALVPAGPFEVALRVDGVVPPDGRTTAPGLAPRSNYEACVETALPTSGLHVLATVVDGPRAVPEFNETNNVYEQPYTAPKTASSPATTPGAAQADLTVSAIKINGQVPDGKDDCKDGKNGVTVVVKNGGSSPAGSFALRLGVDGDEAGEATVDGLEPGKEREVKFNDVRLKKGEHTLTAIADAQLTIDETGEGNNEVKVTAQCKGGA